MIDEPLKAKLYRIDPGVKIFRCKVQTPPGKQFEIRAEAYRRIEAALKDNGITFADNTPRVALYQGVPGEPAAAKRPALEQPMAASRRARKAGYSPPDTEGPPGGIGGRAVNPAGSSPAQLIMDGAEELTSFLPGAASSTPASGAPPG